MSKKAAKTTFIKVSPAHEIYYASRGPAGRGWYLRGYHSSHAMEMFKRGEIDERCCTDTGPFATKEEAMADAELLSYQRAARKYAARDRKGRP